jgi:hypothetical protein
VDEPHVVPIRDVRELAHLAAQQIEEELVELDAGDALACGPDRREDVAPARLR